MKKLILVIALQFLLLPTSSWAELLWNKELQGIELRLFRSSKTTHQLLVQSEKPLGRVVSFSDKKRSFQISFRDHSFGEMENETLGVPLNPLLEGVRVSQDGKIEILLSEEGWKVRRVQETARVVRITGDFPKESFVVDTYIPSIGGATTLQVWNAKIKERKVEPLRLEPLTLEEEEALEDDDDDGGSLQEQKADEVARSSADVKAGLDTTDIGPVVTAEPVKDESVALSLSAGSADITFDRGELVMLSGEQSELLMKNLGLATAQIVLQVQELRDGEVSREQTNQIVVDSGDLTLLPGENRSITLRYIRPSVDQEKIFRILAKDAEDPKREYSKVLLFVQPFGGVARVAWTRDAAGIRFSNNGNISSKFTDIQICEKKCSKVEDIYLYPKKSHFLPVPREATLALTQVVGENSRSGVIPAVKE